MRPGPHALREVRDLAMSALLFGTAVALFAASSGV